MSQIYNFEAHTPPVVTARTLEQTLKRRAFERQMLLLSIAALFFEICAAAAVVFLFGISFSYGVTCAATLCVVQICGGIILVVFLKNRKLKHLLYC